MAFYIAALVSLVLSITVPGEAVCWEHLSIKYAPTDGFYDIPKTAEEIQKNNFVKMAHDDELNVDLFALPNDPRVSIMFDTHGNIAGLRTGYIIDDIGKKAKKNKVKFEYTFEDKKLYSKGKYFDTELYYTSVLFASPDKLKAGGREITNGQVAEDLYMNLEGTWTKLPRDECKATSLGFTKQACFVGMGMHYMYKVTKDLQCKDHQGPFLLYESGELIGLGFNPFGSFTSGKDRTWFENVPPYILKYIVTNGPSCMKDWVKNQGATPLHIFFKKYPRLTFCTWPWQKSNQCE